MNTATDVCPSELDLRAFSLGNLPVNDIDTIGLHIMHCSRCDTLVDAIQQDTDALIAQIRDWMRPVSFESECQLEQLESHARAIKLADFGIPRIPETEVIPPQREDESVSQNSAAISTATFGLSQHIPSNLVEELPGRIGRYDIQKKLGGGGFAHVYLAHDPELNRDVAIKVPRQDRMTDATAAQFLAEGQAAAALSHPNIIKVFDWGRDADGVCYVVMEYIEGQSLSDAIKSGTIDQARAIEITIQVADALHYMHKNSLVHRDVKPANILLDAEGHAHLSDFGLAVHDDQQWQHRDELAGTRPYMSPEQVRGASHHLDGRTDIWSLGAVLYEMLSGRRPFSGRSFSDIVDEIQNRDPKPLRQIDESISHALEAITRRCLSKDITSRYLSAADLSLDLTGFLESTTHAEIESVATKKHRRMLLATVSIVILGVLFGSFILPTNSNNLGDIEDVPPPDLGNWRQLSLNPTIMFSSDRGAAVQFDERKKTLSFDCVRKNVFARLDSSARGDYVIQIAFELGNNNDEFDTGIFFGLHPISIDENGEQMKYQYVSIARKKDRRRADSRETRCTLFRGYGQHYARNNRLPSGISITSSGSEDIAPLAPGLHRLELSVVNHKLVSVRIDESLSLESLTNPDCNLRVIEQDYLGEFGILHSHGVVVIKECLVRNRK